MTDPVAEPRLSIVLPAHNEVALLGSTITNLVTGIEERGHAYEIVVVENGSSDGTLRLARLLAAQLDTLRVLTLPIGDYGEALAAGFTAARGELVVSFDVDYYDLAFLDTALEILESTDAAVVVASKRAPGARDRRPIARRMLTAAFARVLGSLFEMPVSDAHGMKVFRRTLLEPVCEQSKMRQSLFDVEMLIRASSIGLEISEVPATVVERRPPRSPVWLRAAQSIRGLIALRRGLPSSSRRQPSGKRLRAAVSGPVPASGGAPASERTKPGRREELDQLA